MVLYVDCLFWVVASCLLLLVVWLVSLLLVFSYVGASSLWVVICLVSGFVRILCDCMFMFAFVFGVNCGVVWVCSRVCVVMLIVWFVSLGWCWFCLC